MAYSKKSKLSFLMAMFLFLGMINAATASSWLDIYLDMIKPHSYIPPTRSVDLHHLIEHHSKRYGVPPDFIAAIAYIESNYNSCAVSYMGAQGIMQLMPKTAASLGVDDPYNPVQGVQGGVTYLAKALQETKGDLTRSAAFYNAGPKALRLMPHQWPRETRNYIRKLVRIWPKFRGNNWRMQVPKTIARTNKLICSYTASR